MAFKNFIKGFFEQPSVEKLEAKKCVRGLIKTIKKSDSMCDRAAAAEALGKIGSQRAKEPLFALMDDPAAMVRSSAVFALGQLGDRRVIPNLVEELCENPDESRLQAGKLLKAMDWEPTNEYEKTLWRLNEMSFAEIAEKEPILIKPLIDNFEIVPISIQKQIIEHSEKMIEIFTFLPLFKINHYQLREKVYFLVKEKKDRKDIPLLKKAASDKDPVVKIMAIRLLAMHKDKDSIDLFGRLAIQDEKFDVNMAAIKALESSENERAVNFLVKVMGQWHKPILGKAAAEALEGLGWVPADDDQKAVYFIVSEKWEEVLIMGEAAKVPLKKAALTAIGDSRKAAENMLRDLDYSIADIEQLIVDLGTPGKMNATAIRVSHVTQKIKDQRLVKPLIKCLDGPFYNTGRYAALSLGNLGAPEAALPLYEHLRKEMKEGFQDAIWVYIDELGKIGEPSLKFLLPMLSEDDHMSRRYAIPALAKTRHPEVIPHLIRVIENLEEGTKLRDYAARELAVNLQDKAVGPLLTILRNPKDEFCSIAVLRGLKALSEAIVILTTENRKILDSLFKEKEKDYLY